MKRGSVSDIPARLKHRRQSAQPQLPDQARATVNIFFDDRPHSVALLGPIHEMEKIVR